MILIIWGLSFLVSVAPLLGWKDPLWDERVERELKCIVSQDIGYQIFATASSFYVPLLVILILYWRIFQTARKRIRRRQQVNIDIFKFSFFCRKFMILIFNKCLKSLESNLKKKMLSFQIK